MALKPIREKLMCQKLVANKKLASKAKFLFLNNSAVKK